MRAGDETDIAVPPGGQSGGTRTAARRRRSIVGSVLGLALTAAAVWVVVVNTDALATVRGAMSALAWWAVVLLLVLPAINWWISAVSLWILTQRFGRVGLREMTALTAAGWLLNYLPLRPGMMGRIAYHKVRNGVLVRDSVRVLIESSAMSAIGALLLIGIGLLARREALGPGALALLVVPFVALPLAAGLCRGATARAMLLGGLCRWLDLLLWTARYLIVLPAVGIDADAAQAAVVGAVSQAALLVPISGNGLGVREWAVGLALGASGEAIELALAADLLNRAAELLIVIPIGLIGVGVSAAMIRQSKQPDARVQAPQPESDAP
ncbi:MAG: hypothetical protein AAF995_11230 [Planctomycetota bacterium]